MSPPCVALWAGQSTDERAAVRRLGFRWPAGWGPKTKATSAPTAASAAAARSTSLSPLAVPARAARTAASRMGGGTVAVTRVPAPEATAVARSWMAPAGRGRFARWGWGAAVTLEAYRAPNIATPVAVATRRRGVARPGGPAGRGGSTA